MTLHNRPEFNDPATVAMIEAHGMKSDSPDMLADAFRLGRASMEEGYEPQRCEGCDCRFGGATCHQIRPVVLFAPGDTFKHWQNMGPGNFRPKCHVVAVAENMVMFRWYGRRKQWWHYECQHEDQLKALIDISEGKNDD